MLNNKEISEDAADLVTKMLQRDPVKRISALEAINHPWVLKYSK
jgi:serine/threonine protein kinase